MLDDLDETIRKLLIAEIPIRNGEVEISFHQPRRENTVRLTRPTINLFLYDVRENNILRQHQWERLPGDGHDQPAHLKRTPMRVDCTYMITTWATEPDDEHRLLARCMLALFRFPVLPKERLRESLLNQPFEIQTRLASHDKLTNPAEVWSSLDNEIRPSVSYIVTLAFDPWKEIAGPLVHTLTMVTGQAKSLPHTWGLTDETRGEMDCIGGTLRSRADLLPLANVDVAVRGTGLFSTTNEQGRFTLGSLPPGEYTLLAWVSPNKPVEKQVAIPAKEGNYDIEI